MGRGTSFFTGQAKNAVPVINQDEGAEQIENSGDAAKGDSVSYRMLHMDFTKEQKTEVMRALSAKVPKEVILSYFYPETSVMRMQEFRKEYGRQE